MKFNLLPSQSTIRYILPNAMTLANLACGLLAIHFARSFEPVLSVLFILAGYLFDSCDGVVARRMKSTTEFGAKIDALSDAITFGIAPLVLFNYYYQQQVLPIFPGVYWLYGFCAVARYRRHDLHHEVTRERGSGFVGLPISVASFILIIYLQMSVTLNFHWMHVVQPILVLCVSALMISSISFQSFSTFFQTVSRKYFAFMVFVVLAAFAVYGVWVMLLSAIMLYVFTNLFSYLCSWTYSVDETYLERE